MCIICEMMGRTAAQAAAAHQSGDILGVGGSGDAPGALAAPTPGVDASAPKPVWTLDQIVNNFERYHTKWAAGATVSFSFELAAPVGLPSAVGFAPLTDVEKSFVRQAFALIGEVANIKFVETPDDGTYGQASNHISYALDTNAPSYEWGVTQTFTRGFSGGNSLLQSAQVLLNPTAVNQRQWFDGGYNFMALIHETLHALGFPHPGDYNADGSTITYANSAVYAQDSRQYTVLSYFDPTSTGANFVPTGETSAYSGSTPLLDDVATLQAVYGANTTTRTGDTVYGYNSTAGETAYDFTVTTHPIVTIYDGGGNDTIDLSGTNLPVKLDLTPGVFSDVLGMTGNLSIAYGTVIENAKGGSGNDAIYGNDVANHLEGGAGDDSLAGRGGDDVLDGGPGNDEALYAGTAAGYTWWRNADGSWTVQADGANAAEGTDTLTNIESLRFADGVVKLTGLSNAETLTQAFTNILRQAPTSTADAAFVTGLANSVSAGALTQAAAIVQIEQRAAATTSVAVLAYEFFTGAEPTKAGLDYLIAPSGGNAANLNSAYYQSFNAENRYINFAVSLGKGGDGAASFSATYGAMSLFDTTKAAYGLIFGAAPSDAKVHAILDTVLTVGAATETRAQYFASYGLDGPEGIGTKAAAVGWLLAEAVKADIGAYAKSNDAFLADLADGAKLHVDLIGVYNQTSYAITASQAGF